MTSEMLNTLIPLAVATGGGRTRRVYTVRRKALPAEISLLNRENAELKRIARRKRRIFEAGQGGWDHFPGKGRSLKREPREVCDEQGE